MLKVNFFFFVSDAQGTCREWWAFKLFQRGPCREWHYGSCYKQVSVRPRKVQANPGVVDVPGIFDPQTQKRNHPSVVCQSLDKHGCLGTCCTGLLNRNLTR